jgi:hypothetical protein
MRNSVKGCAYAESGEGEKDEASKIISKYYSPEQIPALLETCRHRTEPSHPVPPRLAVTSQSAPPRRQLANPARLTVIS